MYINNTTVKSGERVTITCTILGHPASKVTWYFSECSQDGDPHWPDNSHCTTKRHLNVSIFIIFTIDWSFFLVFIKQGTDEILNAISIDDHIQNATIEFIPLSAGRLTCHAFNGLSAAEETVSIYVQEKYEALLMETESRSITVGDEVYLHCYASMFKFTDSVKLKFNGEPVLERPNGMNTGYWLFLFYTVMCVLLLSSQT